MALEKTAQKAARKIEQALNRYEMNDQEKLEILRIIEKSIVKTIEEASETHREVTVVCCGAEADLAHKIEEEAERKIKLLISNLKSLR